MPFLHEHRRRVPAQNVDRSIVVCMRVVTAMATKEYRLAFATSFVYSPTFGASRRSMSWVYLNQSPSMLLKLVRKDALKNSPSLIKNGAVEPGLLPNISPWIRNGSLSAGCHICDRQVLQHDSAEPAHNVGADYMGPMQTYSGGAGLQRSTTPHSFGVTARTFLPATDSSLRSTFTTRNTSQTRRRANAFSSRKGKGVHYAPINPNTRQAVRLYPEVHFACKADMPNAGIKANCHRPNIGQCLPCVPKLYPSNFWKAHGGPLFIQAPYRNLSASDSETVIRSFLTWGRKPGSAREESGERLIQVPKRLQFASMRHGGDPVALRPKCGQFGRLRKVIQMSSSFTPEVQPPVTPLLKGNVVHKAHHACELPELRFLLGSRVKPVSVCAVGHNRILPHPQQNQNKQRNFL